MQEAHKKVYHTGRWKKLREYVIFRDKDICYFCGQLVLKHRTIHHKEELNESNWQDESIAYDPKNLVECHDYCHNFHHDRFGFKNTIVDTSLEIDYSKRKI